MATNKHSQTAKLAPHEALQLLGPMQARECGEPRDGLLAVLEREPVVEKVARQHEHLTQGQAFGRGGPASLVHFERTLHGGNRHAERLALTRELRAHLGQQIRAAQLVRGPHEMGSRFESTLERGWQREQHRGDLNVDLTLTGLAQGLLHGIAQCSLRKGETMARTHQHIRGHQLVQGRERVLAGSSADLQRQIERHITPHQRHDLRQASAPWG